MNAVLTEESLPERISQAGHRAYQLIRSHENAIERLQKRSPSYVEVLAMLEGRWGPGLDSKALKRCAEEMDRLLLAQPEATFIMQGDTHSLADWREQLAAMVDRAEEFKQA